MVKQDMNCFKKKNVKINGKKYNIEKLLEKNKRSIVQLVSKDNVFYVYKRSVCDYPYIFNQINNPNCLDSDKIIKIVDHSYDKKSNVLEILSKYYVGPDLFYFVEKENISEEKLKFYIKKIILCVKECHDKDIIHLDIKPENFVLSKREPLELVLIDFEFSQNLKDENTKMNNVCGTFNYCAPEMLLCNFFSKKSDIWSIGCCAYTLFTYLETNIECKRSNTLWGNKLERLNLKKHFSQKFVDFLNITMNKMPYMRPDIDELLEDEWLK
jgi:calcium/calmodulin-dependent protein kinase I